MKKLLWLLVIVVIATAIKDVVGYFGPMAAAFRSYRDEAEALELGRAKAKALRDVDGHIVDVSYHLETAEPVGDGEVRLTVVEAIQFQRMSEMQAFGNRRVAQTRQFVLMRRVDGKWAIAHIEENATEVVDLSRVAAPVELEELE